MRVIVQIVNIRGQVDRLRSENVESKYRAVQVHQRVVPLVTRALNQARNPQVRPSGTIDVEEFP